MKNWAGPGNEAIIKLHRTLVLEIMLYCYHTHVCTSPSLFSYPVSVRNGPTSESMPDTAGNCPYVCICVYVYVCMCAYVHVVEAIKQCTFAYINCDYVCACVYVDVCMCACVYVDVDVCMCAH